MILKAYVIYDKVANQTHSQIMTFENDALATRFLKTAKLGDIVEMNLEDFDLYEVGEIDTTKPSFVGKEMARFVCHLEVLGK